MSSRKLRHANRIVVVVTSLFVSAPECCNSQEVLTNQNSSPFQYPLALDFQREAAAWSFPIAVASRDAKPNLPEDKADAKDESPEKKPTLKSLPAVVKEDGSECEECRKTRLVKCENKKCKVGFVRLKINRRRFHKRFPCAICLGLFLSPCETCRDRDYKHALGQAEEIGKHLKRGRVVWIEFLSLRREQQLAIAMFKRKGGDAKQAEARRRAAERRIKEIMPLMEVVQKKNLKVHQAIVAVFNQQLELCLRNAPKSQRSDLRERSRKAIKGFIELFNLGYYY